MQVFNHAHASWCLSPLPCATPVVVRFRPGDDGFEEEGEDKVAVGKERGFDETGCGEEEDGEASIAPATAAVVVCE